MQLATYKQGITAMAHELHERNDYRSTMERLEALRHVSGKGVEFWQAREIREIFQYESWAKFQPVIERAISALESNGVDPSHHIARTDNMVEIGSDATRTVSDYFLSRAACYLIAMNADPSKQSVAAAQAYFAAATRAKEVSDAVEQDRKRLELREKVKKSSRLVSGVAKEAGVTSGKQAIFHDARYQGLYEMSAKDVARLKGLAEKENLLDRMGVLELSANDFQMNLAAETIQKEHIRGENAAINKNKEVAKRVRKTMIDSGSRPPEDLPVAEPIKSVEKRVRAASKPESLPKK